MGAKPPTGAMTRMITVLGSSSRCLINICRKHRLSFAYKTLVRVRWLLASTKYIGKVQELASADNFSNNKRDENVLPRDPKRALRFLAWRTSRICTGHLLFQIEGPTSSSLANHPPKQPHIYSENVSMSVSAPSFGDLALLDKRDLPSARRKLELLPPRFFGPPATHRCLLRFTLSH